MAAVLKTALVVQASPEAIGGHIENQTGKVSNIPVTEEMLEIASGHRMIGERFGWPLWKTMRLDMMVMDGGWNYRANFEY